MKNTPTLSPPAITEVQIKIRALAREQQTARADTGRSLVSRGYAVRNVFGPYDIKDVEAESQLFPGPGSCPQIEATGLFHPSSGLHHH